MIRRSFGERHLLQAVGKSRTTAEPEVARVPQADVVAKFEAFFPGLRARPVLGELDALLDEAHACGRIERRVWLSEDLDETDQVAAFVLAEIPLAEDVLVVTDVLACYHVSAQALPAIVRSLIDGDTIFVPTTTPRVVVLHHSGWAFVLTSSANTNA